MGSHLITKFNPRIWLRSNPSSSLNLGEMLLVCRRHIHQTSFDEMPVLARRSTETNAHLPLLDRDFFVRLWIADKQVKKPGTRGCPPCLAARTTASAQGRPSLQTSSRRRFSGSSIALEQPPPSQPVSGSLMPTSSEELHVTHDGSFCTKQVAVSIFVPTQAHVAPLLARSSLLITRDIEWANLVLGFEQENRYAIVDVCYPQSPVGFIREQSNVITRQLLRLRRPFVAYITDAMGHELFRVHRPFWWITSSIYAEVNGKEIGVVHRRWHLWRRVYDLYLGNKQFAVVENPGFWNWTFTLKDIDGNVLTQIDRDWRGFGFEIFTDAGQYVIRFGSADPISKNGLASAVQELEVSRPLTISERAVAVALAISLDNDYFSRHGGWGIPFFVVDD